LADGKSISKINKLLSVNKQYKILHLEDNPSDAGLIEHALKRSGLDFIVKIVETKEGFINGLKNFAPDIILSDHSLPQFDSMEALSIYNQSGLEIPFILITGSVSEEFAIRSIKEGADDYIIKNNLMRLPAAIQQALKTRQIEAEKRKANIELEATHKELNTFIYKAAHDLRGPLCSIMGLANVAELEGEKENLPQYIHKISESTHKLDTVLISLINVMSIKDSKPILKEIKFETLLNKILTRLTYTVGFNEVAFNHTIETKRSFFSDEFILNTILYNIIENSIIYRNTNDRSAFVNVTITNLDGSTLLQIQDNGIGMESEVQEQIFDMYFRGNIYSTGPGLGLYIVKNGVKKLGGTIAVKSEPGKGSLFTINLPAKQ
jgi:signal transduction histidine kinase